MEEDPPNQYKFNNYREKVIEFVREIDKTFSLDPGRIGKILNKPSEYFSTLNKLKKYICAKVDDKNLSTSERFQLKSLRKCLDFRLAALNSKILPLDFGQ